MTFAFQKYDIATGVTAETKSVAPAKASRSKLNSFYRTVVKRAVDVACILAAAPVVVPAVAVLAVLIARDGGSPFYSQMRVGKNGKSFRMWKLRTMVMDADNRLEEYLATNDDARLEWDTTQKLKCDPRITQFGKALRRSSLDELPQLLNVVMGQMSLVGPRPMMLNQQTLYPGSAYYSLRPGVTGHWQTAGRNRTTFEARAEFDTEYEENLSLWTDVKVIFKTFGVVLKATGY